MIATGVIGPKEASGDGMVDYDGITSDEEGDRGLVEVGVRTGVAAAEKK